jgi:hypothetical protein
MGFPLAFTGRGAVPAADNGRAPGGRFHRTAQIGRVQFVCFAISRGGLGGLWEERSLRPGKAGLAPAGQTGGLATTWFGEEAMKWLRESKDTSPEPVADKNVFHHFFHNYVAADFFCHFSLPRGRSDFLITSFVITRSPKLLSSPVLVTMSSLRPFIRLLSQFTWSPNLHSSPVVLTTWPLKTILITSFPHSCASYQIGWQAAPLFRQPGPSHPTQLLFIRLSKTNSVHVNDVPTLSRHVELPQYADDTALVATSRRPSLLVIYLETCHPTWTLAMGLDYYHRLKEHRDVHC